MARADGGAWAGDVIRDPGRLRLLRERPRDGTAVEEMNEAAFGPERQHLLRIAVEQLPGPRRHRLPAETVEETGAELLLEEPDVLAHRGLGEPEGGCGSREAAELVHPGEHLELPEVHGAGGSGPGPERARLGAEALDIAEPHLFVSPDEVGQARDPDGTLVPLPQDVLVSEAKSRTYDGLWLREPGQFLHDALPRARAFLVRRSCRLTAIASLSRKSQRWRLAIAKMIRKSTNAIAAATPHFWFSKA